MRKIPVCIFLAFSLFSFSQENLKDFLLVAKDSSSFYTFTKKGVYLSSFVEENKIKKEFFPYTKELPKSLLDVGFKQLKTATLNNSIYFLYPGGGILFRYKGKKIERIDKSFAHRNQFTGHFFSYKNSLYLLGGYGYWTTKNYLTKFSFQSGSWDIVTTIGPAPSGGINQGAFVEKENSLFVYDFYSRPSVLSIDVHNKNLFELDLENFKWSQRGSLAGAYDSKIESSRMSIRSPYKESLFEKKANEEVFKITHPSSNLVSVFSSENKLSKLNESFIFVGDNLVYASRNANSLESKISFIDIKTFEVLKQELFYLDDGYLFRTYLIFAAIFSFAIIFLVFLFFKTRSKIFYLNKQSLFNQMSSILLLKEEFALLTAFKNSAVLENNFILNLFSDETKSLDAIIKKKNKLINDLNQKCKKSFKIDLIIKKTDKADSRQVIYLLAKNTRIVVED